MCYLAVCHTPKFQFWDVNIFSNLIIRVLTMICVNTRFLNPAPLVLTAMALLQDKDVIWHMACTGIRHKPQKKIIHVLLFHHQENIVASLFFTYTFKLKVFSYSTTTIPQISNLHCNSSHDMIDKRIRKPHHLMQKKSTTSGTGPQLAQVDWSSGHR